MKQIVIALLKDLPHSLSASLIKRELTKGVSKGVKLMNSLAVAEEFEEELIQLRRYFHAHPELSWKEWNTQKKNYRSLGKGGDFLYLSL